MSKDAATECPKCGLVNPSSAVRCDCGYDFTLGKMEKPYGAGVQTPPYRWGTFVGVSSGLGAVFEVFTAIESDSSAAYVGQAMPPWPVGLLLGAGLVVTCIGVLRRRRFGVIAYFVTVTIGLVFNVVKLTDQNIPANLRAGFGFSIAAALLFAVVTLIYFAKRWRFMDN